MRNFMLATYAFIAFCVLIAGGVLARNDANVAPHTFQGGFKADADSTVIDRIAIGQVDIANGKTSITLTLAGVRVGDIPQVTANESLTSASFIWATATTDTLKVFANRNPNTTLTCNYAVFGKGR